MSKGRFHTHCGNKVGLFHEVDGTPFFHCPKCKETLCQNDVVDVRSNKVDMPVNRPFDPSWYDEPARVHPTFKVFNKVLKAVEIHRDSSDEDPDFTLHFFDGTNLLVQRTEDEDDAIKIAKDDDSAFKACHFLTGCTIRNVIASYQLNNLLMEG